VATRGFLRFVARAVARPPLDALPADYTRERPCVIGLDNSSARRSKPMHAAIPAPRTVDASFFYLPPYSPELIAIEPLRGQIKFGDPRNRGHTALSSLLGAVDRTRAAHAERTAHAMNSVCTAA